MKKLQFFLLIGFSVLAFGAPARAHVEPIHPVQAVLKAYPGRALVRVEVSAPFWFENILDGEVPASDWPRAQRQKAADYLAGHFKLKLDGRPLIPELIAAALAENPWGAPDGGRLIFDLSFPFPAGGGRVLSGRSAFYENHWKPVSERPAGVAQDFVTDLELAGRGRRRLSIPFESPDFEVSLEDARRSPLQRGAENFLAGLAYPWKEPEALLFIAAALFFLPKRRAAERTVLRAAGILAAAFFLGWAVPERPLVGGRWLCVVLTAAAAGLRFPELYWEILTVACVPVWALSLFGKATEPLLAAPPWPARLCFFLGAVLTLSSLAFAFSWGLELYRRRLKLKSETQFETLLIHDLRFAGGFLALVGFFQLIQALKNLI